MGHIMNYITISITSYTISISTSIKSKKIDKLKKISL